LAINIVIKKTRAQKLIRIQIVKEKGLIWVFERWGEEISIYYFLINIDPFQSQRRSIPFPLWFGFDLFD
jgi:hypothetical protein